MKNNLVAGLPQNNSHLAVGTVETSESSISVIEEFLDVPGTVEQISPVSVTLGRVKALGGYGREKTLLTAASNEGCRQTMFVSYLASILRGLQKCETWSKGDGFGSKGASCQA